MTKVYGLGLSRTGTTTLNNVLVEMGYNVVHYPNPQDLYNDNIDGATDISVIPFYKQLDTTYPGSKFILTLRDKQQWLDSIVPYLERKKKWSQSGWQVQIREMIYGSAFPNREQASNAWDRYHEDVRKHFYLRPHDLLEINLTDNSSNPKQLAQFLNCRTTLTEWPHYNKLKDGRGVQVK